MKQVEEAAKFGGPNYARTEGYQHVWILDQSSCYARKEYEVALDVYKMNV